VKGSVLPRRPDGLTRRGVLLGVSGNAVSRGGMKTKPCPSEFQQFLNGRAICIYEIDRLHFVAFGYIDGLRKKGFRYLGRYETLQLAVETGGAFLRTLDISTFRYFRTCVAAGRFEAGASSERGEKR
jgi:hypothetical protein